MKAIPVITLCFLIWTAGSATAQQPANTAANTNAQMDEMQQKIRDLEDRIIALEGELRQLKSQPATPAPAAPSAQAAPQPAAPAQAAAQPAPAEQAAGAIPTTTEEGKIGGAGASSAKALNPDISVIGDFIGSAGHNPISPTPSVEMHESELGLQAIIDPYARGDFFISFGEEGVELEEGYITLTALPKGFVAKAGKMRAAFGKVNSLHNHVLPWVDRPLVTQNLVGGEDGIDDAGISVQHIIPAPKDWFVEFTGQAFRGDSSDVFQSFNKDTLSVVGHLRGYKDLTDNSNLDLGLSYSRGHNRFGQDFLTNLYGVDATYRWKPLQRAIYHSFIARSEFIWRKQDQPLVCSDCPVGFAPGKQRSFGYYASGDYQFARRWFVGGRFDSSDRALDHRLTDHGGSLVLTYWPSEFAQVRGQYRFTRYAENLDSHEFFLQLQFALGAHGAHPF
jgi:hypothetical protein